MDLDESLGTPLLHLMQEREVCDAIAAKVVILHERLVDQFLYLHNAGEAMPGDAVMLQQFFL